MATLVALIAAAVLETSALAQVDCRNGKYCPKGNICLKDDMCGERVGMPPGSTPTSTGSWCEPGFREHKYRPGSCVPIGYSDCTTGGICPPGSTCTNTGNCTGGNPRTGPVCGGGRCEEGRICSSAGRCMNTTYYQDCGGGVICSKNKACSLDGHCATVGIGRTAQIPYNQPSRIQNKLQ
jgi:hypothetical protein